MRKALALILAAILFLDAVCLGVIFFSDAKQLPYKKEDEDEIFKRASVVAVGNNIIGDEILRQASSRSNSTGYDFAFLYENTAQDIEEADEAIITHEGVFSSQHNVSGYPLYNAPADLGKELKKTGFDTVSIATNHILDYGEQGLVNTCTFLKDEIGLNPVGAYTSRADTTVPVIRNVNGIKIAYIAFTQSTNEHSLPENSDAYLLLSQYESKISEMINEAKAKADFVIVCAHWGDEYGEEITAEQENTAKKLGDWGADVIIGTHPHELQKIEYITNSDGTQTLVAYSLGNFVSGQEKGELLLGGMLKFDLVKNTSSGEVSVENVNMEGVVTHYGVDMSKIRLYKLSEYTQALADVHGVKARTEDFSLKYLKKLFEDRIDNEFTR